MKGHTSHFLPEKGAVKEVMEEVMEEEMVEVMVEARAEGHDLCNYVTIP